MTRARAASVTKHINALMILNPDLTEQQKDQLRQLIEKPVPPQPLFMMGPPYWHQSERGEAPDPEPAPSPNESLVALLARLRGDCDVRKEE